MNEIPRYNPPPRGLTQNPLVQIVAIIAMLLWWRRTYTQEPVYGQLLRRAGSFGAVALVGSIAFVFGVERQPWWISMWLISIPVLIVTLIKVSERNAYNQAWLRDQMDGQRIQDVVDEQHDFESEEQAARAAAYELNRQRHGA